MRKDQVDLENKVVYAEDRSKIEDLHSRGVAQPGSAPALGAGGRWFESSRPDHFPSS